MAQEETHGIRDLSYSAWHRRGSTQRFVGIEAAQTLSMIDLDAALFVEWDDGTKEPLLLIETAMDKGQSFKTATITKNLARRVVPKLPAYVVLYKLGDAANPVDIEWKDIVSFRVRRIWPEPETPFEEITPQEWANRLVELRRYSAKLIDRHHEIMAANENPRP